MSESSNFPSRAYRFSVWFEDIAIKLFFLAVLGLAGAAVVKSIIAFVLFFL